MLCLFQSQIVHKLFSSNSSIFSSNFDINPERCLCLIKYVLGANIRHQARIYRILIVHYLSEFRMGEVVLTTLIIWHYFPNAYRTDVESD